MFAFLEPARLAFHDDVSREPLDERGAGLIVMAARTRVALKPLLGDEAGTSPVALSTFARLDQLVAVASNRHY